MKDYLRFDPERSIEEYERQSDQELRFDKFRLDEEYEEQPRLYDKWSKWWGKTLLLRKKKEASLERVKGEVDLDIRKNPKAYGLIPDDKGKVMESAIKAAVLNSDKVKEAEEKFYEAYALAKALESSVKSFEQRKELLRGAGELWINKYYSGVQVSVEDKAQREESKEDIHDGLSDRMQKRNKRRNLE